MEKKNIAPVKWAQRSDSLYVTIDLRDVTAEDIKLTNEKMIFSGVSEEKKYELELEFLHEVDQEGSVWKVLPRSVQMNIKKKDVDQEFWPRLLKDKHLEKTNVSIDWDRYEDEDDEAEAGGFDMSALQGGSGFGGMGDYGDYDDYEDEPDSDDDDLPDLEDDEEEESKKPTGEEEPIPAPEPEPEQEPAKTTEEATEGAKDSTDAAT
mmetsp:Transcript_22937/g.33266  ORF Transcript_22937/g.33266 Transcript_22937/m.33266 type:complete len:207 (-) Transcript_22937:228-848(-)|eukprot:CAMPEP_0113937248 /NCGR_PEP_ID=MMETSP1339-20121228/3910_1 /TAXON_ID=94617 /ORGANISM="Fibrocapsa japonica" /LENGTH=206 /DNA_ID=CAMNT_0000939943 /DNA_START=116 /DNA_END=736 /DNA_ORIENTATION=- /assembly_acc=CAM_ASM_000762